jgi:hypothetical protein
MPLGANKAAIMGVAGVSAGADVVLIYDTDHSNVSAAAITSGIDSTYGEYIIKFYNINPASDGANWTFQGSTDGGSSYGVTVTTTTFRAYHTEDDGTATLSYVTGRDLAQSTDYHQLIYEIGNGADESCAGKIHLFNPASTTYVKHFYSRVAGMHSGSSAVDWNSAGYFNTTSAINALNFKFSTGNFDGTIKMWGVK